MSQIFDILQSHTLEKLTNGGETLRRKRSQLNECGTNGFL